jgi:biotin transport system permease protein
VLTLYLPGPSWLHRLPAGLKLLLLAGLGTALPWLDHPLPLAVVLGLVLAAYASLGRRGLGPLAVLRPLLPLFALLLGFQWWAAGLPAALVLLERMAALLLLAHLITLTTPLEAMLEALRPVLAPLRWFGLRPERIGFALALLLRFVPVLVGMGQQLRQAWRARGGRRQQWRLAVPLSLRTLGLGERVDEALAARGGIGRGEERNAPRPAPRRRREEARP